jgi:hypothetical protein
MFAMIHLSEVVLQCVYYRKQDWHTNVQKNLCQFVLYYVGNSDNLYQYGEGFLLVIYFIRSTPVSNSCHTWSQKTKSI